MDSFPTLVPNLGEDADRRTDVTLLNINFAVFETLQGFNICKDVYYKVYYARIIIEILSLKCHVLNGICFYLVLKYSDTINFVIFLLKV